jgi:adenylylsulfate kinase
VCRKLTDDGFQVEVLDGDIFRSTVAKDLGFSRKDREENVRRLSIVADLLSRHGVIVLVAAISPYRAIREQIRQNTTRFLEVYVNAPLAVCEQRDVKGLYRKARNGEVHNLTGVDDVYEPPLDPDVECHTDFESLEESAEKVITAIIQATGRFRLHAATR